MGGDNKGVTINLTQVWELARTVGAVGGACAVVMYMMWSMYFAPRVQAMVDEAAKDAKTARSDMQANYDKLGEDLDKLEKAIWKVAIKLGVDPDE